MQISRKTVTQAQEQIQDPGASALMMLTVTLCCQYLAQIASKRLIIVIIVSCFVVGATQVG